MTIVEHLDELRRRLIIAVVAIAIGSIVGFVFYQPIFRFILGPYRSAVQALPLEARPSGALAGKLVYSSPVEPFLTFLKVGFFTGFLAALITPGLTSRERRYAIPFVTSSVLLFALGTAFAFLIVPRGLSFLFSFGGESLVPLLTVDRYFSFLIFLVLAFGLSFELPLVLLFLAGGRFITSAQMRHWRRWALLGTAVFAAVATPTQDPYTMLLLWVPLYLLYEAAILIARLMKR
jgi:sec-independent protein translocase protein TatC